MRSTESGQLGKHGRKGGYGCDDAPHHLQRRGGPQRLHQTMEGLCAGHQSGLGADGPERPSLQRRDRWQVLSIEGAGSRKRGEKPTLKSEKRSPKEPLKEYPQQKNEWNS